MDPVRWRIDTRVVAGSQSAALPTLELNGLLTYGLWGVTIGGSYILLGRYNLGERLSERYDFGERLLEHRVRYYAGLLP